MFYLKYMGVNNILLNYNSFISYNAEKDHHKIMFETDNYLGKINPKTETESKIDKKM